MASNDDSAPTAYAHYMKQYKVTSFGENFEDTKSKQVQERVAAGLQIRKNTVPVSVAPSPRSRFKDTSRRKFYLVPSDLAVAEFCFFTRKRLDLRPEESLFFLVNGDTLPALSSTIGLTYQEYKNTEDNFLHFTFYEEETYG